VPVPEPLWAAAGGLAREHGINRTAKARHLEYGKLKERAEALGPAKKQVRKAPSTIPRHARPLAPPTFMELISPQPGSAAPRHLSARDRFIGWAAEARRRNIRFVAYDPRYLILPWARVPHLASHILDQVARRIAADWEQVYGHPIYCLETFVDPERYRGTCYRAANWVVMGRTTGRGKNCPNKRPNRSIKEVLGYPLTPRFRRLLAEVER